MPPRIINGIDGLRELVGQELGESDLVVVDQAMIDGFAEVTGDRQWIHTDPERAAKESPFNTTIAHGYLTVSLLPVLVDQVMKVEGVSMAVNYGFDKLRFPAPVPAGSKVRLSKANLQGVEDISGGVQVTMGLALTVDGADKPSLVATALYRFYA